MNPLQKVFYRLWNIRQGPEEFYFSFRAAYVFIGVMVFAMVLFALSGTEDSLQIPSIGDALVALLVGPLVTAGCFYLDLRLSQRSQSDDPDP